jgi:predicted peptidase
MTGLSRGGHGTWGLAAKLPDLFAAIIPVAGSTDFVDDYANLVGPSIWIAVNTGDGLYSENQKAIATIEPLTKEPFLRVDGPDVTSSDYLDHKYVLMAPKRDDHDAWTELYTRSEVFKWMLQQSKSSVETASLP